MAAEKLTADYADCADDGAESRNKARWNRRDAKSAENPGRWSDRIMRGQNHDEVNVFVILSRIHPLRVLR